jgi:hypothetical protein
MMHRNYPKAGNLPILLLAARTTRRFRIERHSVPEVLRTRGAPYQEALQQRRHRGGPGHEQDEEQRHGGQQPPAGPLDQRDQRAKPGAERRRS